MVDRVRIAGNIVGTSLCVCFTVVFYNGYAWASNYLGRKFMGKSIDFNERLRQGFVQIGEENREHALLGNNYNPK